MLEQFWVLLSELLKKYFCNEGLSTPTKGRKFEGMSSKTKMSARDDILGQVSTNL